MKARGIPCTGIEPTASTAAAARQRGIPIVQDFFGIALAESMVASGQQADLMIAKNVLAHVPDINDFVQGFARLLKPTGVATFEFPHLVRTIQENQFDTIYHEHFSYLSLTAVRKIFKENGLSVFDVQELQTHGGSLRVFAQRTDSLKHAELPAFKELLRHEEDIGISSIDYYKGFQAKANRVKNDLISFLIDAHRSGKTVAAYGAAAKGNTLLNYAGIRNDLVTFVVDKSPSKQDKYLPGSRIPIVSDDQIQRERPDYVLVLPWNLMGEIMDQLAYVRHWNAKFVRAVPKLEIS